MYLDKKIKELINNFDGNVSYLKLNAFRKNIPSINLYKKLGFEEYFVFYQKEI